MNNEIERMRKVLLAELIDNGFSTIELAEQEIVNIARFADINCKGRGDEIQITLAYNNYKRYFKEVLNKIKKEVESNE